jgi:hypothetical protein
VLPVTDVPISPCILHNAYVFELIIRSNSVYHSSIPHKSCTYFEKFPRASITINSGGHSNDDNPDPHVAASQASSPQIL